MSELNLNKPINEEEKELFGDKGYNGWKVATIFLFILLLVLIVADFFAVKNDVENKTSAEALCSKITGTPSWFDWNGDLIDVGYKPFNYNGSIVDELIKGKVYFVYSSGCGYCQKQIDGFGVDEWKKYVDSGLTRDCATLKG